MGQREYAIYFDDDYQFAGTAKYCADRLGIKVRTLIYFTTPVYKKRAKTGIHVVDLGMWRIEEDHHEGNY